MNASDLNEMPVNSLLIAQMKNGVATGEVLNWRELVDQVKDLEFDYVENYLEAAGTLMAIQAGVQPASVRRPLKPTIVK